MKFNLDKCQKEQDISFTALYFDYLGDVSTFAFECLGESEYPSSAEYKVYASQLGLASFPTVQKYIDCKWDEVLKAAGLDLSKLPKKAARSDAVTYEDCIHSVKSFVLRCIDEGIYPSSGYYSAISSESCLVSMGALNNHIGDSWPKILKAAGFTPELLPSKAIGPDAVTYEDCLGDVASYIFECIEAMENPTANEYQRRASKRGWVAYTTLLRQVDKSWPEILKTIGYDRDNSGAFGL